MATMEVSIENYNGMLDKIKELEDTQHNLRREIRVLKETISEKNDSLDIFRESSWYDRVFGWKQILNLTKENEEEENI